MDAILSVNNEVEKVYNSFLNCNQSYNIEIDRLLKKIQLRQKQIEAIKAASNDGSKVDDHADLLRSIVQETCDEVRQSCSRITNSHRELHVPVSKIGKTIDKNFNPDFAIRMGDTSHFLKPENKQLLNDAIVQHFLRQGMVSTAESLIKEAKIPINDSELAKFYEIEAILTALRNKDVRLALKWAIKNRKRLREIDSPLEFKIHRINIVEFYKQGIDKQHDIIQYARDNLQHLDPAHNLDIQHLMGGIIYLKTGIENSPYRSFLDPVDYREIEELYVSNACSLLDIGVNSPISVVVHAGCIALPALLDINQSLAKQGVQSVWQIRDELPIEISLGRKLQFHSTFSCPILKQQSTEANPPMRLVCGHVISREALHKLSSSTTGNKLKCPYCPIEQVLSDATQIHF